MDYVDPRHLVSPPPGIHSIPPPPGFEALGTPPAKTPPPSPQGDLPVKGMTFTDWPEVEAFINR